MQPKLFTMLISMGLAGSLVAAPAKKGSEAAKSGAKAASAKKAGATEETASSASDEVPKSAAKAAETATEGPTPPGVTRVAAVSSIEPEALAHFDSYPPQIQTLIRYALDLTKRNLTYTFGSSDPAKGGMDCSGTIFHLLTHAGISGVPRQSDEMCNWVRDLTLLHEIKKADSLSHAELSALNPGDLLFWSGTYTTAPRKTPVTHVMLYLGKLKKNGKSVVFGASDGRVYEGARRTGVSIFDFSLPRPGSTAKLYGYGLIPGVGKVKVDAVEGPPAKAAGAMASKSEQARPTTRHTTNPSAKADAPPEEVRRATAAKSADSAKAKSKVGSSNQAKKKSSKGATKDK